MRAFELDADPDLVRPGRETSCHESRGFTSSHLDITVKRLHLKKDLRTISFQSDGFANIITLIGRVCIHVEKYNKMRRRDEHFISRGFSSVVFGCGNKLTDSITIRGSDYMSVKMILSSIFQPVVPASQRLGKYG